MIIKKKSSKFCQNVCRREISVTKIRQGFSSLLKLRCTMGDIQIIVSGLAAVVFNDISYFQQ